MFSSYLRDSQKWFPESIALGIFSQLPFPTNRLRPAPARTQIEINSWQIGEPFPILPGTDLKFHLSGKGLASPTRRRPSSARILNDCGCAADERERSAATLPLTRLYLCLEP